MRHRAKVDIGKPNCTRADGERNLDSCEQPRIHVGADKGTKRWKLPEGAPKTTRKAGTQLNELFVRKHLLAPEVDQLHDLNRPVVSACCQSNRSACIGSCGLDANGNKQRSCRWRRRAPNFRVGHALSNRIEGELELEVGAAHRFPTPDGTNSATIRRVLSESRKRESAQNELLRSERRYKPA